MDNTHKPVPNVPELKYKGTADKPDIKIFVSHRIDLDSETIDNPLYIPVRCGAVYDERENVTMLGDDTGDNISEKREKFCELTVQYWAWKNVEADYYGLCHYRRFLSFAGKDYPDTRNEYGFSMEEHITKEKIKKYNLLNDNIMGQEISKYDLIYSNPFRLDNVTTPKGKVKTLYEHWQAHVELLDMSLLDVLMETVEKMYPEFLSTYKDLLKSETFIGYNCFIMKKELFYELCEFEFNVLFAVEKKIDTTHYSHLKNRYLGFLGEFLYTTFILYKKKHDKKIKVRTMQIVFFLDTSRCLQLLPFKKNNNIPIVTISSDYYAPYISVYIQSILSHSSEKYNYDIIVLSKDMSEINKQILMKQAASYDNASVRFIDTNLFYDSSNFFISSKTYSADTYSRLFTPWILKNYRKAIVTDCDIIAINDIANLYTIELDKNLAGIVKDTVMHGWCNIYKKEWFEYLKDELQMDNPYDYVNTGVMLLNLTEWRNSFSQSEILNYANRKKLRIQEQDLLNIIIKNRFVAIDIKYNYFVCVNDAIKLGIEHAPLEEYDPYYKTKKNPVLIHFASQPKPWNSPSIEFAEDWWHYARQTPFYEILLQRMYSQSAANTDSVNILRNEFSTIHFPNINARFESIENKTARLEKITGIHFLRKTKNFLKRKLPPESLLGKIARKIYRKIRRR